MKVSAGIPSPPLALFIVMLPNAHLTSHSRMSGSRWVTTSLCFSYLSVVLSGILHSVGYIFSFLLCLSLLFSIIYKAPSDIPFAFLHFFTPLGMVLVINSYTMLQTSVHNSLGTVSTRSSPLNLLVTSIV